MRWGEAILTLRPGHFNPDFHGPKINQRFGPEGAKKLGKNHLGGGETLIIIRPSGAYINAELLVDG